jgi:rhodanese-related sulfurtransferase
VLASLIRILVILGVACGAAASYIGAKGLPWIPDVKEMATEESLHAWLRANRGVTLEEFLALIDHGARVIDVRSRVAYEEGHLAIDCDIPVLNVPADEIDVHVDRLVQLTGLPVVLYCASPTCDYAEELYLTLQEYGFLELDIWIFFPGWEGIQAAGLPTVGGPDTWTGFDQAPPGEPVSEDDAYGDEEAPDAPTSDEPEP